MDGNIGRNRGAAGGERFKDQRGIKAGEARATDIIAHINAAHAERRRLLQHIDGKVLLLIPFNRLGGELFTREIPRHIADGFLLFVESKQAGGRIGHCSNLLF